METKICSVMKRKGSTQVPQGPPAWGSTQVPQGPPAVLRENALVFEDGLYEASAQWKTWGLVKVPLAEPAGIKIPDGRSNCILKGTRHVCVFCFVPPFRKTKWYTKSSTNGFIEACAVLAQTSGRGEEASTQICVETLGSGILAPPDSARCMLDTSKKEEPWLGLWKISQLEEKQS